MGFGLLFFGYCFLLDVPYGTLAVDLFPDLWGFLLLLAAAKRLCPYQNAFFGMQRSLLVLLALELCKYGSQLSCALVEWDIATVLSVLDFAKLPCLVAMQYFMLLGMSRIAKEVGLDALSRRCRSNLQIGALYYLLVLIGMASTELFAPPAGTPLTGMLYGLALTLWIIKLFAFVWIPMNLIQIGRCYFGITLAATPTSPASQSSHQPK